MIHQVQGLPASPWYAILLIKRETAQHLKTMTRTVRITLQFDIDELNCSLSNPIENPLSVGEIAAKWWARQTNIGSFEGKTHCSSVEIIDIDEPKAKRYSAAFTRSLEKKRAKVAELMGWA